ncbi:hypothetical protein [Streptomyces jumonjinensis]|uniref:hypothetical protein n=1 Tax=Streptomyces jumonjinensis TaxID=1945 RepID=UPI00378976A3
MSQSAGAQFDSAAKLSRTVSTTGCLTCTESLYAPCQHSGGVAGVIQGTLIGGLPQQPIRIMASGLGFGQNGDEGVEGRVCEDPLRLARNSTTYAVDVPVHERLGWPALGEGGQWSDGGLVVGDLEMQQSLVGGCDLLVVMAELMPASCGDDDEDGGVEKHRQGGSVLGRGLPDHRSYSTTQGTGLVVFRPDAGASGAFERGGCVSELGPKRPGARRGRASRTSPKAWSWAWEASSSAWSRW